MQLEMHDDKYNNTPFLNQTVNLKRWTTTMLGGVCMYKTFSAAFVCFSISNNFNSNN